MSEKFQIAKRAFDEGKIVVAITTENRRVIVRDMQLKGGLPFIKTPEGWTQNFKDFQTFDAQDLRGAQTFLMRQETAAA